MTKHTLKLGLIIVLGLVCFNSAEAMTVTANGTAQVDTAQSKFGGGSLETTNVTTDFLSVPDSAEFAFGAGDFTLEVFYRNAANPSLTEGFINQRAASQYSFVFFVHGNSVSKSR